MTALEQIESQDTSRIAISTAVALLFAGLAMLLAPRLLTPRPHAVAPEAPLLEAEIVEHHEPPKLREVKPETAKRSAVPLISKKLADKPESKAPETLNKVFEDKNQTESGPSPLPATHGPVAVSSPAPKLPDDLKNQNVRASVLIEFFISAKGEASPKLIGSSGNDELDALAISAAKKWIFQPAADKGLPIDSKMRLRINFEVE